MHKLHFRVSTKKEEKKKKPKQFHVPIIVLINISCLALSNGDFHIGATSEAWEKHTPEWGILGESWNCSTTPESEVNLSDVANYHPIMLHVLHHDR